MSEDAGMEPRTVAALALAARRYNHLVRSHPQLGLISFIKLALHCSVTPLNGKKSMNRKKMKILENSQGWKFTNIISENEKARHFMFIKR